MKIMIFCLFFSPSVLAIGEAVPFALLKKILPENPVILEAGAQFGEDTQWMAEFWPKGMIYAFEPLPDSYSLLQKTVDKLTNVSIFNKALSDKKGKFNFYVAGGASSLLRPTPAFNNDYFHADLDKPILVECICLDEWARENGISHIDFMWLDMEGNEISALKGGMDLLKTVKLIYIEVNFNKFWENCALYEDVKSFFEQNGFDEIWADIVPHWHGNILFARR